MKNLKNFACLTFMFAITACILCGFAYGETAPDNYLKMKGKVLDGYTADITVFQEIDGDWISVRTMKSRKNYTLKLNPESNYYVLFDSGDGLHKVLYVDAGTTGMWIMQLDINFDQKNIKYARVYQHPTNGYNFKVVHKDNQKIVIGKVHTKPDEQVILSEHIGK